jgi:hypothetical protein
MLDGLQEAGEGQRSSRLDTLRRPPTKVSGSAMIGALGCGQVDASVVPPRRLAELFRYGMEGKATLLGRHTDSRRLATLLATVVYLPRHAEQDHRSLPAQLASRVTELVKRFRPGAPVPSDAVPGHPIRRRPRGHTGAGRAARPAQAVGPGPEQGPPRRDRPGSAHRLLAPVGAPCAGAGAGLHRLAGLDVLRALRRWAAASGCSRCSVGAAGVVAGGSPLGSVRANSVIPQGWARTSVTGSPRPTSRACHAVGSWTWT